VDRLRGALWNKGENQNNIPHEIKTLLARLVREKNLEPGDRDLYTKRRRMGGVYEKGAKHLGDALYLWKWRESGVSLLGWWERGKKYLTTI